MVARKTPRLLKGFTLVELIVVITILAILGTVWFLSIGGYSSNARDSERATDIANVSKSLDAYVIASWSYPSPDNSFSVTYSGGVVWYQGTFGTGAYAKLGWTGISKRPLDPLKNTEYVYSTLAFWKAYSIKADYEGTVTASNLFVNEAYAATGNPDVAYIRGNFGGLSARTETGGLVYVLAVPSIITNTGSMGTVLEIRNNTLSGTLVFNGKKLTWASSFNPTTVVFSGASLPKNDNTSQITNMMAALKNAYASSDVASVPAVQTLVNTATGSLATMGSSVIVSQLGGVISSGGGTSNLVSGTCTGLPVNGVYFNSSTSYSLSNAPEGTSLTASWVAVPRANTCEYRLCSYVVPTTDWSFACGWSIWFSIPDYQKVNYASVDFTKLDFTKLWSFTANTGLWYSISTTSCAGDANCVFIGNNFIVSPSSTNVSGTAYTYSTVSSFCSSYTLMWLAWTTYENDSRWSNATLASKLIYDSTRMWYQRPDDYGRDSTDWWGMGYGITGNTTNNWTCTWCGSRSAWVSASRSVANWERRCIKTY